LTKGAGRATIETCPPSPRPVSPGTINIGVNMIRLHLTWLDDSTTDVIVDAFDDYWVMEAYELRVWFPDDNKMELMEGVKSVQIIK
jgi:hypothetical protein